MSSGSKTSNLGLNVWSGTDKPQRVDFNSDNAIIDSAIGSHRNDNVKHITADEREKWNSVYYKFSYTGDSTSTRTIDSNCPFQPTWGIVFAHSYTPQVSDYTNKAEYNYFAVFTQSGSMTGVSLTGGNKLKVYQSATAVQGTEYRSYNQNGVTYTCIMFR